MPSLPAYARLLLDDFGIEPESALMRTEMDSGPPKQTKIKSRVMVSVPAVFAFDSKADYLSFMTWFRSTIHYGADWFNWDDPVSGTVLTVRIPGGKLGKATPDNSGLTRWRVPCTLEYWSA